MPVFDYYTDILVPIKNNLEADARFGGRGVNVFYDRTEDRQVALDLMPAVSYFLLSPWDDTSIGVGAYSIQNRLFTLKIGICIWVYHDDPEQMEISLTQLGGDMYDFLREREHWDRTKQIAIQQSIPMDIDYPRTADGKLVGAQMFAVTFDQYAP